MVTEDEKKMPVLEALHSALISSDESDEEGSQNKAPRVEIRGGFHVFFTIWTLPIEEVCPTSKKGNLLTEGLVLQVQEAVMKFLSHCCGPLKLIVVLFIFLMLDNSGASIHF